MHGASLDHALEEARAGLETARDQAFLQEAVYGSLRRWFSLRARLRERLSRPLRKRDAVVECLLVSGLHQLWGMSLPAHAVVDQSVVACEALGCEWAKGLVNAILRKASQIDPSARAATGDEEAEFDHPRWLIEALREAWPGDWQRLLHANQQRPPLTLRVNLQRGSTKDYLAKLAASGLVATQHAVAPAALSLAEAVPIAALPGFAEGDASVQDAAAQLAAPLLDLTAGARVLDACAAPGGKTTHLLELAPNAARCLALDASAERINGIHQNVQRLGLACEIACADARFPEGWWDGVPWTHILLDAPCSGTGVIRRHPDIKLHRDPTDIAALAALQRALLDGLWPTLSAGGLLLYVTCSVLPAENELQVARFCSEHDDCVVISLPETRGRATGHGRQILTGEHDMDGFFFCLMQKRPNV